jgi:hypothetical protein
MKSNNLYARLERLEKQNNRLQQALTVLFLSLVALMIMGAKAGLQDGHFAKITAKNITIVDAQGNELIEIGTDESKGTGMRILNKDGTRLVGIGVAADGGGSGLLITDKMGRARFGLGMDMGIPSLAMTDENGKKIIGLGGDESGYGLVIMDGNEVERAGIGYKEGSTGIAIYDDKGQYVRGMVNESGGKHYSSYIDENGNEIILD